VKSLHFLNQVQLADRWHMSPRTLERWRWLGQAPRFTKIGGKVLYRLEDIQAFEGTQLRQHTPRRPRPRMNTISSKEGADA
jgi:hypothetical protein